MLQTTCVYCRAPLLNRVCTRCGRRHVVGAKLPTPEQSTTGEAAAPKANVSNLQRIAGASNAERMARAGGSAPIDSVSNAERQEIAPALKVSNSERPPNAQRLAMGGGTSGRVDSVSNSERLDRALGGVEDVHVDSETNAERAERAGGTSEPVVRKVSPPEKVIVLESDEAESAAAEEKPRKKKR